MSVEIAGAVKLPTIIFDEIDTGDGDNTVYINSKVEAVSPSLIIVADNVLANSCPLAIILWRVDTVSLNKALIFNSNAQSEKWFNIPLYKLGYENICKSKIIRLRIKWVCIKIPKQIRNVHKPISPVWACNIM